MFVYLKKSYYFVLKLIRTQNVLLLPNFSQKRFQAVYYRNRVVACKQVERERI
jgi:hypothetical protein